MECKWRNIHRLVSRVIESKRFRWVDLQFQELARCLTEQELKDQLRALPKTLEEAYERILLRSSRPKDLKIFLQWMAFSAEPLSVSQMADTLAMDVSSSDRPSYNRELRYMDARKVLSICSGLVTEYEGGFLSLLSCQLC